MNTEDNDYKLVNMSYQYRIVNIITSKMTKYV